MTQNLLPAFPHTASESQHFHNLCTYSQETATATAATSTAMALHGMHVKSAMALSGKSSNRK